MVAHALITAVYQPFMQQRGHGHFVGQKAFFLSLSGSCDRSNDGAPSRQLRASEDPPSAPLASLAAAVDAALQRLPLPVRPPVENLGSAAITVPDRFLSQHHLRSGFWWEQRKFRPLAERTWAGPQLSLPRRSTSSSGAARWRSFRRLYQRSLACAARTIVLRRSTRSCRRSEQHHAKNARF